jgi:hypothetical protein
MQYLRIGTPGSPVKSRGRSPIRAWDAGVQPPSSGGSVLVQRHRRRPDGPRSARGNRQRLADSIYQGHCQTVASNAYEIERAVADADLVIGGVLVPGARAPMLVPTDLAARMKPGAVLVDISIDQGG